MQLNCSISCSTLRDALVRRALQRGALYHDGLAKFSTTARKAAYSDTIPNLKIGSSTRVIYQGFTGVMRPYRIATINAKESLEYGTNIVGGVKPGVEGEHLGLPIVPSVRAAAEKLKPNASAIYVPGNGTAKAIEEAIEAEIPLVVAVAEHIPIHDILRVHQMLQTQSKTRLTGANAPGIINTHGRCRLGFQPLPFFQAGKVGIVAKSGTLSYETVASTTRAGLGQTYCISMGGDVLAGTTFVEALPVLEDDEETEGMILVGEVGGRAEEEAAEWIVQYRRRSEFPKPIMAIIGGIHAPRGRVMGHAGAWAALGEADAANKCEVLEKAGVVLVDHPEKFGDGMKKLLSERFRGHTSRTTKKSGKIASQSRGFHTLQTRPELSRQYLSQIQKRSLYLKSSQAFELLRQRNIQTSEEGVKDGKAQFLALSIDRAIRRPCVIASPSTDPVDSHRRAKRFPFSYGTSASSSQDMVTSVTEHLSLPRTAEAQVLQLLESLASIFMSYEAFTLSTHFTISPADNGLIVHSAHFGFDDAAFRSSGRQSSIHSLRDTSIEDPLEVAAEPYGIMYVKLDGEGSIGTLVNGAGLAMNTVDALFARGGHPANFIDTGGKATSETIKGAFKIISHDERVKAILVNIFGGLTRCEMIAEGILMAFKELNLRVPVVVRLRGTNEKLGQDVIRRSGLPVDAYDGFEEAAARVIELARTGNVPS